MTCSRIVHVAFLPLLSLSACGGDGGVPIDQLGNKLLDAVCTRESRCGTYPDKATCVAANSELADPGQLKADVASGKASYDGSQAASCLAAFAAVGCTISESQTVTLPPSCDTLFKGTVASGGACYSGEECVSQRCNRAACAGVTGCCAGTCDPTPGPPVASGGDCLPADSVCAAGTSCKLGATGTSATCVPLLAAGQSCTSTFGQCVDGKTCNSDPATGTRTCGTPPAEGQACPDNVCNATIDACDSATRTCVHKIGVGGACPTGAGCVNYANCDATTKVCVRQSAAGGACTASSDCLGSLVCTTNTCVAAPALPVCP